MRAPHLRHLLFVLLLVLATGVAATGGAGAGTTSVRLAAASPSPYLVSRSGTSYQAVSQVTGTTFSGTLKSVVESAVQSLEQSGGGTVSFTAGDFDLGSGFFLLHQIRSITFAGQGMDTTVIHNSSDVAADTEPFNFQDTDHVLIRDLTVRAGGALRSTSDAIDFDRGNNSTVERVKITGSRAKGIIFDGKNDSWTSTGNTVRDCVIQNVPSNGIEFLASSDNLVEGCAISDVGRTGIEMGKSSTTADQPNKKSSGNTIRNNRIDNAGLNGIYVKSGDRNQILGNTITNSSDDAAGNDGIRISSADSISCDANVVDGNTAGDTQAVKTQVYGLRIGSSLCHDTTVGTNSFTGNRTGAILDLGTNTHYNAPTTDSTAPVTSIACNGGSCGGSFTGSVSVSLSASDAGSGVKATYYTVDGSDPASSATRVAYSAPFTLAASATVRFSSLDNAGNVEAAKSQAVTIGSGGGGTGGTVTLTPVADAYVSADAPAANYGTLTSLRVDGSPLVRSFVRFSVGGLGGSVTSATLRVYANSAQSPGFDVYGVASTTWSETGITYGTAPALGSKLGSSGAAAAGSWKTVDVTAAVSGNGSYSFALATTGSTALSLGSRESANKPQLIIQTSSGGAGGGTSNVALPARAAFYYAWFPETWQVNGVHVSYHPTLGYYDSSTQNVVDAHIRALDYGGVRVAIASWWGQGVHSEQTRIPLLLDRTRALGSSLKWAVYYEQEGQPTNPTVSQLQSDLAYIKAQYASSPSYAYVDGKPVIFVYNANDTTCEVADRWAQAAAGQWYVSLKVFNGFAGCTNQPASWHQYAPALAEDVQAGYSVEISPGYRRADEPAARLARDLDRWRQNVRDLVASKEPWQLVTTFNEWGEGTSVESAAEWASASGYGSYLDALHNDGN